MHHKLTFIHKFSVSLTAISEKWKSRDIRIGSRDSTEHGGFWNVQAKCGEKECETPIIRLRLLNHWKKLIIVVDENPAGSKVQLTLFTTCTNNSDLFDFREACFNSYHAHDNFELSNWVAPGHQQVPQYIELNKQRGCS